MDFNEMYSAFGQNLCCLRMAKNMTQKEMAQCLEISVATLRKLEKNRPTPRTSAALLLRIYEIF